MKVCWNVPPSKMPVTNKMICGEPSLFTFTFHWASWSLSTHFGLTHWNIANAICYHTLQLRLLLAYWSIKQYNLNCIFQTQISILFVDTLIHQRKRVWHIGSPKMSWSVEDIETYKRTKQDSTQNHPKIQQNLSGDSQWPNCCRSFVVFLRLTPPMSCNGACQSSCPIRLGLGATSSRGTSRAGR